MKVGNVWDLVGDDSKRPQTSKSPSSHSLFTDVLDVPTVECLSAEVALPEEELNEITGMDLDRERSKSRDRSTSSTIKSIRKYSSTILNKIGITKKKSPHIFNLEKSPELSYVDLKLFCKLPVQTLPIIKKESPSKTPMLVSSTLLKDVMKKDHNAYMTYMHETNLKRQFSLGEEENIFNFLTYTDHNVFERMEVYDPYCPLHGSKRNICNRKKLMDMKKFVNSVDTADKEEILQSDSYLAKVLRKCERTNLPKAHRILVDKAKNKILSNMWIISIGLLFLFIAFHGLQNLQTSINGKLGSDSLAIFYLSMALSSLYLPPVVIHWLGCKITLMLSIVVYIMYMCINFYPSYYTLIPASILCGFAGSCLRAAQCSYITECGIKFARINIEAPITVIVRFFGYFFMTVHLGQVIGNIMSSLIITAAVPYQKPMDLIDRTCGHAYRVNSSYLSQRANHNLEAPPRKAISSVVGVYICCSIISLLIISLFLNALKKDALIKGTPLSFRPEMLKATMRSFKKIKVLLLVPLTIFNGFEQAFIVGLYTKAYVGCGLGISQIGFIMTSFGVADAVCSLVFGPLIKLFGRMPLFVFGAVINMLMIITLLMWPINPGDFQVFYVIAGVWGMADGVWNTQINGFWIALVGNDGLENAFAHYRFWESSGMAIGLYLIRYATVDWYLISAFIVLFLGMCCYFFIELYQPLSVQVT
uniref:MFS domain-containing protein n=1 Tax=Rhabditophanes sp. KR3021 TaxID=114890 RepID=A0AC35TLD6_9BILA